MDISSIVLLSLSICALTVSWFVPKQKRVLILSSAAMAISVIILATIRLNQLKNVEPTTEKLKFWRTINMILRVVGIVILLASGVLIIFDIKGDYVEEQERKAIRDMLT